MLIFVYVSVDHLWNMPLVQCPKMVSFLYRPKLVLKKYKRFYRRTVKILKCNKLKFLSKSLKTFNAHYPSINCFQNLSRKQIEMDGAHLKKKTYTEGVTKSDRNFRFYSAAKIC